MSIYEADSDNQLQLCFEFAEEPRLKAYEVLSGTLLEPVATFKRIARERPVIMTIVMVALIYAFTGAIGIGESSSMLSQMFGERIKTSSLVWLFGLVSLPVSLLIWIVMSAVYSFLGSLIYRKNNVKGIMCTLGLSLLPGILSPPLKYIATAYNAGFSIMLILVLFLAVWTSGLQVIALRESLKINTGQAFVLWIIPLAVVFAIIILAFIGILAGMVASLI
ncbi:MAG: Yip1 family protein [Candidatus Saccharibacteria bacterium]